MSGHGIVIAGLVATTVAIKAVGPVALGGRDLPPAFIRVIALMAPALLTALIATNALADGRSLAVGADTAGVAVAAVAVARGGSVVTAVLVAAAVTAGLRAVGV